MDVWRPFWTWAQTGLESVWSWDCSLIFRWLPRGSFLRTSLQRLPCTKVGHKDSDSLSGSSCWSLAKQWFSDSGSGQHLSTSTSWSGVLWGFGICFWFSRAIFRCFLLRQFLMFRGSYWMDRCSQSRGLHILQATGNSSYFIAAYSRSYPYFLN